MKVMSPFLQSRIWCASTLLGLAASAGCGSDEVTNDPDPVYYAVAYGTVEQSGAPVTGVELQGEIYLSACPPVGAPTSNTATRSGAGGRYRLLLASADSTAGQCLRLSVAGAPPLLQTLGGTAFSATSPAEVTDSVKIDLVVP
jgi:hypothetical protein